MFAQTNITLPQSNIWLHFKPQRNNLIICYSVSFTEWRLHDVNVTVGGDGSSFDCICGFFKGPGSSHQRVEVVCQEQCRGRYVRLQIVSGSEFLQICEVEVYSNCNNWKFRTLKTHTFLSLLVSKVAWIFSCFFFNLILHFEINWILNGYFSIVFFPSVDGDRGYNRSPVPCLS